MKELIGIISILTLLSSCDTPKTITKQNDIEAETGVKVQKLMETIEPGLFKVEINDSTTILLYRGVQSCTMIKI